MEGDWPQMAAWQNHWDVKSSQGLAELVTGRSYVPLNGSLVS